MKIEYSKGSKGGIELFLLGIIVIGAFFLVGGVGIFKKTPSQDSLSYQNVQCCDSGNGDACKPLTGTDQKISYKGIEYGLLRSETVFVEGNLHLKDSLDTVTIKGKQYPVVLNWSDTHKNFGNLPVPSACDNSDTDKYLTDKPNGISLGDPRILSYCTQIPNEQIIYVCKENCPTTPTTCSAADIEAYNDPNLSCYGDSKTKYDAYFRLSDYNASTNTGVPDFVKNCKQKTSPQLVDKKDLPPQKLVIPSNKPHDNLQLNTFNVIEPAGQAIPWFSPFCKPAIYLYPEQTQNISVKVNPVGPFTYTDPLYPQNGWNITAFPDGKIISNSKEFPYLYYEADIPSILIPKPEEGFVVKAADIQKTLNDILPKLGLNTKETTEMANYWQKSLPESAYYFIGVIPEKVLDSIAPLDITPKPATTIRVALYFEAQEKPTTIKQPNLSSKERTGFTAVEWGGILKTEKPFVCLQ